MTLYIYLQLKEKISKIDNHPHQKVVVYILFDFFNVFFDFEYCYVTRIFLKINLMLFVYSDLEILALGQYTDTLIALFQYFHYFFLIF